MECMKICFFTHAANLTGANKSLINLIEEIKEKNVISYVVIPEPGPIEDELKRLKVTYKIIKTYPKIKKVTEKDTLIKKIKRWIKNCINIKSKCKIIQFIKKEQIDIIHVNTLLTYLGAKVAVKCKVPFVWHIREFLEEDHNLEIINVNEIKQLMNKANAKIAISESIYNRFSKIYGKENMQIVYNGIPVEYNQQNFVQAFSKEKTKIMIVGRIVEGKGQMSAIKAIEYLTKEKKTKNIELYIIGSVKDGSEYEKNIKKYVEENDLDDIIQFVDFTPELSEWRSKCDIALVCSKKEAFGRVTIEAMLYKQLVIASNTGANEELIDNGKTGLIYEETSYKDLAEKIEFAINNKEEMKIIANNANSMAMENFTIANTANNILEIYKKILK